ncbi:MAG: dihydroxyacetone kinase subunit DhaK, partial [Mycobacterium sp.]
MTAAGTAADHHMRKILNTPEGVVDDYLAGLAAAHRDIIVHDRQNRLIMRADAPVAGKVGIVAGGGSGCEPLH